MHIYQPVDLVLGLLMFPLGLLGLGQDLYRVFTRTFRNRYGDWRSVGLSLWFVFGGPAHVSKALDPRYHASHRTAVLQEVEVFVLSCILISGGVAWIVRRRQKSELGGA